MDIYRIEASPLTPPEPANYETELATIQCILDACEAEDFSPLATSLARCGELTSWVSLQLSLQALEAAKNGKEELAYKLGIASLEAALVAGDKRQYFSNMLDQADALLRLGRLDDAIELLHTVVNEPTDDADHARPGAHISLASIYRQAARSQSDMQLVNTTLYHLERGLRYIHSSVTPEQRQLLLAQFEPLYLHVKDVAGLLYCAQQLGHADVPAMLRRLVTPETSADDVVALSARLRALGAHDLADIVRTLWRHPNPVTAPKPVEGGH